jgi:hypothetical protein
VHTPAQGIPWGSNIKSLKKRKKEKGVETHFIVERIGQWLFELRWLV